MTQDPSITRLLLDEDTSETLSPTEPDSKSYQNTTKEKPSFFYNEDPKEGTAALEGDPNSMMGGALVDPNSTTGGALYRMAAAEESSVRFESSPEVESRVDFAIGRVGGDSRNRGGILCILLFSVLPVLAMLLIPMLILLPILLVAVIPIIAIFQMFMTLNHFQEKHGQPGDRTLGYKSKSFDFQWNGGRQKSGNCMEEMSRQNKPKYETDDVKKNEANGNLATLRRANSETRSNDSPMMMQSEMIENQQIHNETSNEEKRRATTTAGGVLKSDFDLSPFLAIFAVILLPVVSLLCIPVFLLLPLLLMMTVPLLVGTSIVFVLALPVLSGFAIFPTILLLFFLPWRSIWLLVKDFLAASVQRCSLIVRSISNRTSGCSAVTSCLNQRKSILQKMLPKDVNKFYKES